MASSRRPGHPAGSPGRTTLTAGTATAATEDPGERGARIAEGAATPDAIAADPGRQVATVRGPDRVRWALSQARLAPSVDATCGALRGSIAVED